MKQFIFFILFLNIIFGINAQNQQDLFKEGNKLYKKGKYQEAISNYEKALHFDKVSPELFFNLGNSYYKINRIAPAIYYYEKALKLDPGNKDILNNLNLTKQMRIDKIKKVPKGFIHKIQKNISKILNSDTWAIFSIIWSFIGLLSFGIFLYSKNPSYKRSGFVFMFISLFLLIFSWYFAKISKKFEQEKYAVIFVPKTELLNEPNLTSDRVISLHEGTKIQILRKDNNWFLVKIPNGKQAWIPKSDIKIID